MDLRNRAMSRLAAGESVRVVAAALCISVSSVVKWSQRLRRTGCAAPGRIAFFIAEMLGQLRPESPLDQGLLQLLEKPFLAKQILRLRIIGQKLVKQLRSYRRFVRHVSRP